MAGRRGTGSLRPTPAAVAPRRHAPIRWRSIARGRAMSEERREASVPDSAEPGAPPDLASSPPPAVEMGSAAAEPVDEGSAPLRRRPRTLRIPDDEVSRPRDGLDAAPDGERRPSDRPGSNRPPSNRPPSVEPASLEPVSVALVPMRIITINPPPPPEIEIAEPDISEPDIPDDVPTPRDV